MRNSAQGVLSLTLMLNTLFRAGSGGNSGCTCFFFLWGLLCWPMTSAQWWLKPLPWGWSRESAKNGFDCASAPLFNLKFAAVKVQMIANISRR